MAANKIEDVRDFLIAQIEILSSETISGEELTREIEKSKSMSLLADKIIGLGKLEVEYMHKLGLNGTSTHFFQSVKQNELE